MAKVNDRPVPAPRRFVCDRKPPVPERSAKLPVALPRVLVHGDCANVYGATEPSSSTIDAAIIQNQSIIEAKTGNQFINRSYRRARSWPNSTKCITRADYCRPNAAQSHETALKVKQRQDNESNKSDSSVMGRNYLNDEAKLLECPSYLDSEVESFWHEGTRRMRTRASTISTNSVAGCVFSRSNLGCSADGNKFHDMMVDGNNRSIRENTQDAGGGVWNPGYVGLEDFSKLTKFSAVCRSFIIESSKPNAVCSGLDACSLLDGFQKNHPADADSDKANVDESGTLFACWIELTVNKKEQGKVWMVLEKAQLFFSYSEDKDEASVYGPYEAKNFIYVGHGPAEDSIDLLIKESVSCNRFTTLHLAHISLVDSWLLRFAKCFMPRNELLTFSLKKLTAAGCVWIRQGAAGTWSYGWMYIDEHKLYYVLDNCSTLFELDIRKFVGLKSSVIKVDWCALVVGSERGPFLLIQEGGSLFVQGECDLATFIWNGVFKNEMDRIGDCLEDCKLTVDDVPVLVEKCIKFISAYGLFSPGLYRHGGSTTEVRQLFNEFRKDPLKVHLTVGSDEVNVVADVLCLFFRQLDSPLIPYFVQERLLAVAEITDWKRLAEYSEILISLPRIRLQTLRKVLGHLIDVTELAYANNATTDDIAKIFGPALFSVDSEQRTVINGNISCTTQQVNLLKDLLQNYTQIFHITARERSIKSKMSMFLLNQNQIKSRADGLLVPVHLIEKDNHTFNVQSSCTAEQVCEAARNRPAIRNETEIASFALFEEIKGGQLERRVNSLEKMSTMVTGRWLDWEPSECYLLFKKDSLPFSFQNVNPFANDVKLAEPGAKYFSTAHLKLEGGLVTLYNKACKKVNEWSSDDLLWFIGHEVTRRPPYPHTLTFILQKNSFKYKTKHIGYCVAFRENTLRRQWLNAAVSSQSNFHDVFSMPLIQI